MKSHFSIFLTLLIISLGIISFNLIRNGLLRKSDKVELEIIGNIDMNNNNDSTIDDTLVEPKISENSDTADTNAITTDGTNDTPKTSEIVQEDVSDFVQTYGSVSGKLCYPSEAIPKLEIFLVDVANKNTFTQDTQLNQDNYSFEDIPSGKYIAYAYVKDMHENGGGYTEMVPCGLSIDCEDHTLIEFDVSANENTTGINICDWYGADIPQ